ncbi:potassium channel family protein [Pontibacter ramchanderi]|uniref:Ion channel n=1 Tax=Pontibacter ramchanderi TaxID=1179743 RepID=A0A2N3U9Y8_9BACT|nr:potassium channel family protein [Pontibacter ramchanderi]PKV63551.1 ion channel [Pontibacter ramchanderi]
MLQFLKKLRSYWLGDVSFVVLLIMLVAVVFVLPVIMEMSEHGVLLFNVLLLSVFLSGTFSTDNYWVMMLSAILFGIHLTLRIIRFGDNPYSYYVLENVVAIANTAVFLYINFRLLFRDQSVNVYRIIGAVNVYLLLALMGALTLEVIHAVAGVSIGGNVLLTGSDRDYVHFIYFSLTSLTTVGFGDIYPISTGAKMVSTSLAAIGILFPAIVIARLVGLASQRTP